MHPKDETNQDRGHAMTTEQILTLAQIRNCNDSSALRLNDAFALRDKGDEDRWVRMAAIDSLRCSVGISHADFVRASA